MPKFGKGDYVMITEGAEAGKVGTIDEITYRGNKFVVNGNIPRYRVCTLNNPTGILLPETKLDVILDSQIPLLEKAAQESHLFVEISQVKGGFNSIKLGVFEDETGNIPHFHFYKGLKPEGGIPKNARSSGGCICIESPNYFIHATHKEKMDRKEIKGLIDFLHAKNTASNGTNWEYIISVWNNSNPSRKQVPVNTKIPEYTHDMESIQDTKKK